MSPMDNEKCARIVKERMDEILYGQPKCSSKADKTALIARKFRFRRKDIRDFLK